MPLSSGHALMLFRHNAHRDRRYSPALAMPHARYTLWNNAHFLSLILSSPFHHRTMLQQVCESYRLASFVLYKAQTALRE